MTLCGYNKASSMHALLLFAVAVLTALHVGVGVLCLGLGPSVLLVRPGGLKHKERGRVFLRLMAAMGASAFLLLLIRFNSFFFVLAVFSYYLAFSGYRVLRRKSPGQGDNARAIDWAAATLAAGASAGGIAANAVGILHGDPVFVGTILGGTLLVSVYDLHRFARPLSRLHQPMLWFYEHLGKLLGAYIAVVAAFSATVLTFIPTPLRQLWPVLVGMPVMIALFIHYRRKFDRVPT